MMKYAAFFYDSQYWQKLLSKCELIIIIMNLYYIYFLESCNLYLVQLTTSEVLLSCLGKIIFSMIGN